MKRVFNKDAYEKACSKEVRGMGILSAEEQAKLEQQRKNDMDRMKLVVAVLTARNKSTGSISGPVTDNDLKEYSNGSIVNK